MSLIASWPNSNQGADRAGSPRGWRRWRAAWTNLVESWTARSWHRRVQQEEAYLSEAVDLYDLDRRMRDLDSEVKRARFIGYF